MEREDIIRDLIDKSGMNVKAFSAKAGLPYSTLRSMLERGIGNASVDNVIKVCKALNITVEQLHELAKNPITNKGQIKPNQIETLESDEFTTPESAMEFLIKQPAIAAYGGYNIKEMGDTEIVEFANELLRQLKLLGYKYKK